MLLRKLLLSTLFLLFCSLSSLTVYAASQEECCARLLNGDFLPLACGTFLGDSVLSLPERMQMGIPPRMCGYAPPPLMGVPPTFGAPAMMDIPPMMNIPLMFGPMYF